MRANVFLVVVLLSIVAAEVPNANAQVLPGQQAHLNPDVVTFWHKLGIPQGVARTKLFKDSLVNRNGLKPGKERKPRLLRIADPANLEEGKPEMLKVAAKMKIDQDLAPQKIKALKYISSVGCSCYNKQTEGLVEKAIVEGMKDCSLDVRIAAMCVVLDNAGNACSCQGLCGTCCSPGVVKALEEIAYKTDDTGCYLEPNEQVRNLAQRALAVCPAFPEKKVPEPKPPVPDPDLIDKGGAASDKGVDELTDPGTNQDENDGAKKKQNDSQNGNDTEAPNSANSDLPPLPGSVPVRIISSRTSHGPAWNDPALEELEIRGVVDAIQPDLSNVTIELVRSYRLPVGSPLVIACDEENISFGTVISSQPGNALIKVDDLGVVRNLGISKRVRLGIVE